MVYIVLGMHKSGTTLISELLHHSGVSMTEEFDARLDYDSIKGKMECPDTVEINNLILGSHEVDSLDIQPPDCSYQLPPQLETKIQTLIQEKNEAHSHWGIKDPRMCLTYKLWKPYLPDHKVIFIYRNPFQVVKHYQQFYRFPTKLMSSLKALRAYTLHNQMVISILNDDEVPFLVMNYNELMENPNSIQKLSTFTGIRIDDRRNSNKYRKNIEYHLPTRIMDILFFTNAMNTYESARKFNP